MIRVLFISHYPGLGGANLSMLSLITYLKQGDIEPVVFIPSHGPIEQELKKLNIPYEIHRYASLRTPDKGFIVNIISSIVRVIIDLYQAINIGLRKKGKVDIIHSNSSLVFLGIFLKLIMKKPLVWHLREFGTDDYPLIFSLGKKLSAKCYQKADRLIAISSAISQYYHNYICSKANIQLIYNGIDENVYKPRIVEHKDNITKICIVGGISPSKNQLELINAAEILLKKTSNFIIDIIGDGDKEYITSLKRLIQEKKLNNNIRLLGKSNNIGYLLPDYQIGIATSKKEAFGRVVIEYMMSQLSIIACNSGAFSELIKDGNTGLMYKLGDEVDLSNKIYELLTDVDKRDTISKQGREYALTHFTAKKNAYNIFNLYKSLL